MKTRKSVLRTSLVALTLVSAGAFGHTGQGQGGMGMMGGMGMKPGQGMHGPTGMMDMSVDDMSPEQLDQIGEHIQAMHESMQKVADASDLEARRDPVKKHIAAMQAFMRERHEVMREQAEKRAKAGEWQQHMEQRMHLMEEMIKERMQQ